ncbi:MFS general substrate transporter [Dendrothele bispora CBS 962.96]|uniref:MFS general substrate transporter n=1 Tax=Dendrothele bispora (strain CBS 962.96) TaxID=1314807 RepID=A0A4S8MX25_DENBC|nr:MFS general substrate transporter [Dendrothele bispora CBS 962.96]
MSSRAHDEATPLLEEQRPPQKTTPLPVAQLATVCLVRLADPISFCQIFPYINEFIAFLNLTDDPSQIGFYSGLVESSFAVAQLLSIYTCSRLSDSIGRRPVIMMGVLGVGIATICFGLSTSLTELLLSRSLAGLFAGTGPVNHAILGEITDHTNQAAAFPIYGLVWPFGGIIGPLIGGSLSEPAKKYEFFKDTIFDTYPYFLPCLIAGFVSLLGFFLAYICLEETLPSKTKSKHPSSEPSTDSSNNDGVSTTSTATATPSQPPATLLSLLRIPVIRTLCFSGFALESNVISFNVLFVLFSYTPISPSSGFGGLGFSASKIGFSLAVSGMISTSIQIFMLPFLLKRVKAEKIYGFSMRLWPVAFLGLPILGLIARLGAEPVVGGGLEVREGSTMYVLLWVGIGLVLAVARLGGLAYGVSMILVRNHTPNSEVLGTTNGLVQLAMCISRMISPTIVRSVFIFFFSWKLLDTNQTYSNFDHVFPSYLSAPKKPNQTTPITSTSCGIILWIALHTCHN